MTDKTAEAQCQEQGEDRRNFLVAAIYGFWGLITTALVGPAAAYLLLPPKTRPGQDWIEVARVEDLPLDVPEEIVFRRNRFDGWKLTSEKTTAWVVRQSNTRLVAFTPQCTHLGCAYHWDHGSNEFLCPCHTSTFSLEGEVLSGPAPRSLDRYQVKIDDGKLLLGAVERTGKNRHAS